MHSAVLEFLIQQQSDITGNIYIDTACIDNNMWRWIVTKDYCGSKLFEHPSPDGDGARGLTCKTSTLLVRIALVVFEILTLTLVERITGIL